MRGPLPMTLQIPPNSAALLLRQIGEVLYGPSWPAALSQKIDVSDRTVRRWASGQDPIPPGVWRDILDYARSQWLTLKYFDDQLVQIFEESRLHPIPNTDPLPDCWGLHFALATKTGRPIRCFIQREVLDDRVSSNPMKRLLEYFKHTQRFFIGWPSGNLMRVISIII